MTARTSTDLSLLARSIRASVLAMCYRAHVGHIGPALSIADIMAAVYGRLIDPAVPGSIRFILSKGHAAAALYAALELTGHLPAGTTSTYCSDGTALGMHPDTQASPAIGWTTGSLGHGLSVGIGMAMGTAGRVVVLMSDAELNEGSVWEAVMFAGHRHLNRLTVVVDDNGQQAFGKTADIINLSPVGKKFAAFGWKAVAVDGHDTTVLTRALLRKPSGRPTVIVARTVSGKGVGFMEGKIDWHYWPLTRAQYETACSDIGVPVSVTV